MRIYGFHTWASEYKRCSDESRKKRIFRVLKWMLNRIGGFDKEDQYFSRHKYNNN